MTAIAPRTLCYLRGLVDQAALNGRVVTVETGPLLGEDGAMAYLVRAHWIAAEYDGRSALVPPGCLLPITGPRRTLTVRRGVRERV